MSAPTPMWLARLFLRATIDDKGCWVWQEKSRTSQGYALGQGPTGLAAAHRLAYEALVGPIPEGLQLDHLCYNPPCINPSHLEPVTRQENMRRARERYTHCKNGHEFNEENTRITTQGGRQCLPCKRAYERDAYYARKAERQSVTA